MTQEKFRNAAQQLTRACQTLQNEKRKTDSATLLNDMLSLAAQLVQLVEDDKQSQAQLIVPSRDTLRKLCMIMSYLDGLNEKLSDPHLKELIINIIITLHQITGKVSLGQILQSSDKPNQPLVISNR